MANSNGNKYAQIAALWGVDVNDSSIQLLQEFDRRFEELKRESSDLKRQNEQWTSITAQLLGLVRDQNKEARVLSHNTEKLSMSSERLSQALQNYENQIAEQVPVLNQLNSTSNQLSSANGKLDKISSATDSLEASSKGVGKWIQELSNNLASRAQSIKGLSAKQSAAHLLLLVMITLSVIQGILLLKVQSELDSNNAVLNSALRRLQRLEER